MGAASKHGGGGVFSHLSSFPQFCAVLCSFAGISRRYVRWRKKEALHIEESPGPFNTIRTSGYHHGLFDSPFYQTNRNVFFLLRLSTLALLVPSIHPSLVRATRLWLMANRVCFWMRLNFAS